jgi:hypothetical protein
MTHWKSRSRPRSSAGFPVACKVCKPHAAGFGQRAGSVLPASLGHSTLARNSLAIPNERKLTAVIDRPSNTTFNGHELPMRIWALTRTSLDGRGISQGTTRKVEIEQLNDGSFLLMRYEAVEAALPTSDHWYASLEEAYDECDHVYDIGRDDWLQR